MSGSQRTKGQPKAGTDEHEVTQHEIAAAKRIIARRASGPAVPRFKVTDAKGKPTIEPDKVESALVLLTDLLATGDDTFSHGILIQLANAAQQGAELTTTDLNVMISTVAAIRPREPTEALLASQMAAVHSLTMLAARRLRRSETILQQDSASNILNKLARTFAVQVETLKRYRSTGEQNIRVQHVTVHEGGQAIVGNVKTGGGGPAKSANQSHAPGRDHERGPALLGNEQALRAPMPGTCGEGPTRVPHARSARGGTDGSR